MRAGTMIFSIGTDIAKTSRFEKWTEHPDMFLRFFNDKEQFSGDISLHRGAACCHYAARFAAKEAFSKALGTGFAGLSLSDFYVAKDKNGKPRLELGEMTRKIVEERAGKNFSVHLSLSHEKEYAIAFVVIEIMS